MASNVPLIGGYDCKFVDTPPDKLICQICLHVARTSHQMPCCGRVYCKACLDTHKQHSNTCPNCRKTRQSFPDTRGESNQMLVASWFLKPAAISKRVKSYEQKYIMQVFCFQVVASSNDYLLYHFTLVFSPARGMQSRWLTDSKACFVLAFICLHVCSKYIMHTKRHQT